MKRFIALAMMAMVLGTAVLASAATEVKMTGDARIHGTFYAKQNFTGWNFNGTRTSDTFAIWERFRLRTDFIANEGLKFRLGIRVNNTPWGNGTFTVDNPAVSIDVYQAFLQFKWPGTDVEFTIGMQDFGLPLSNDMMNANPVFGGTRAAAAIVSIPVVDAFKIVAGYTRFLDSNRDFDPTTTQVPDEFDAFFLALPITLDGFAATPWGALAIAGRNANYAGTVVGGAGNNNNQTLATNLVSAGFFAPRAGFRDAETIYWWVGTTLAVTALDPFKFYGDVIYGANGANGKNYRRGLFFDVAAEYTGLDMLTPQVTFWYSTGEDSSTSNGSERMPVVVNSWGASKNFLMDSGQSFVRGFMGLNPIGSWGFTVALDKITFIQDLSHRLAFTFANGTNSPRALRVANVLTGAGNYVQMGRDLTTNEYEFGVNFDNQYNIYENLAAIVETGWAHGTFERNVWGRRMVNQANNGDAWKVAFGLQYKF
jgi:hypothetical protein